jgi:molybdate transport system substrate-binding protein
MKTRTGAIAGAAFGLIMTAQLAMAAEVKVLTAGAMKEVVLSVVPEFEQTTGHKVTVMNATVGALVKRIEGGETFDLAVLTPAAIDALSGKGKIAPATRTDLGKVGVGVAVKEGAARPDIGNVEAFKRTLLDAKSIAYNDPASGASSGIYVARMLEKLGIADALKPKTKLKQGGYVADLVVSGEAEIGIHQISEILPVKGAVLVGPLPAEIQNYTTYAVGIGAGTKDNEAARTLIRRLAGPTATAMLKARGMERPSS